MLRIRIGLHGATADQGGHEYFHDEGGWYRGPVLNHAARISDTGHGGQIVASDMVKEYCPLPRSASWEDLGAHNLKSLDEAYHIYGLCHPDLTLQAFPALRTPANKKYAQVGSQLAVRITQQRYGTKLLTAAWDATARLWSVILYLEYPAFSLV